MEALINVPDGWIVQGDFPSRNPVTTRAAEFYRSPHIALPPFFLRRRYYGDGRALARRQWGEAAYRRFVQVIGL